MSYRVNPNFGAKRLKNRSKSNKIFGDKETKDMIDQLFQACLNAFERMGDHFNDPVVGFGVIIVKEKGHMPLCRREQ